jgi:uncharacterized protein (TIGR02996 family)
MMLAAKLSWLMRSLTRRIVDDRVGAPLWKGEPKDLFDIHLLLTQGKHSPALFQKSLLAIGANDNLDWRNLEAIFDVRRAKMTVEDFANWSSFRERHSSLITCGPDEMLQTIADRLEPLLGDFYRREEMPFLLAINASPVDELAYLVYADWLEDRRDERSTFLRLFAKFYFHQDALSRPELIGMCLALRTSLRETALVWLQQLFGTSARFREITQRIEEGHS